MDRHEFVEKLHREWETSPRWRGIRRPYTPEDVWRLRGSVEIEHTLARRGTARLWKLLHEKPYVPALSAITGNQAIEEVQAGPEAIYVSGWQVAGDMNEAGQGHPDQRLYPSDSIPQLLPRLNQAPLPADQIPPLKGRGDWPPESLGPPVPAPQHRVRGGP